MTLYTPGKQQSLELSPPLTRFGQAERTLFDESLKSFSAEHPKLEKDICYLGDFIANPLYSGMNLAKSTVPKLKSMVVERRKNQEIYSKLDPGTLTGLEQKELATHTARLGKYEELEREADQRLNPWAEYTLSLFRAIKKKDAGQGLIIIGNYSRMDSKDARNEAYRDALKNREQAWPFGWDVLFNIRTMALITSENEQRTALYNMFKEAGMPGISDTPMEISSGRIQGTLETSTKNVFEGLMPKKAKLEEHEALEAVVRKHFQGRLDDIFKP